VTPNDRIQLVFERFDLEYDWDFVRYYPDLAAFQSRQATKLWTGTVIPQPFESTQSSYFAIEFDSDQLVTRRYV
jgi:hypothetical protein